MHWQQKHTGSVRGAKNVKNVKNVKNDKNVKNVKNVNNENNSSNDKSENNPFPIKRARTLLYQEEALRADFQLYRDLCGFVLLHDHLTAILARANDEGALCRSTDALSLQVVDR